MNKTSSIKKTAAMLLGVALCVGGAGCDNFILTDSAKDLAQTVATVDISPTLKDDPRYNADVATDLGVIVNSLSNDISKMDLVSYFMSTGYQYVQSYGYTYEDTFNMLMDGLVSREIMVQYAIAYYLGKGVLTADGCEAYIEGKKAAADEKTKALYEANPEVLTLEYFLTNNGTETEEYDKAVYSLKKSLNDSLDSLEQSYIKTDDEEHDHEEARTLPTGVDTENEDYVPDEYEIYTGSARLPVGDCGKYEAQEGSTTATRQKAYNAFLANLQGYNMIGKDEDTSDVTKLNYYYVELASSLGQALINKYFEAQEDAIVAKLSAEYVEGEYDRMYASQLDAYQSSPTAYSTALDGLSDTSFMLYGLKDFGFVYNILLPFSAEQNIAYTTAKNRKENDQNDLYNIRKGLLSDVKAKDLRGSWISEHDHANYSSFVVPTDASTEYTTPITFFEENLTTSNKYEKLKQYAGTYAYNGKMVKVDGEWKAKSNSVDIDEFIALMEDHIVATAGVAAASTANASYDEGNAATDYDTLVEDGDYSQFIYKTGKVTFNEEVNAKDYFVETSEIYKTVSAVNELMFAYSTDTGCLNTYLGYSVSPYSTNFVKEFEYAAREAIKGGVGTYVVCATDYGWHIVFASYVYGTDGDVYGGYDHTQKDVEGSFSNLFYESLKSSTASNYASEVQGDVLNRYNNGDSVTLYKSRYKDLLELDA